jgi:hypothetical protein
MAKWLKQNLDLPYTCNVNNSLQCAQNTKKLKDTHTHRIITLDITNLYTNIPSMKTLDIIKTKLQNDIQGDTECLNEACHLINVAIKQNYFKAKEKVWQQTDGTPMGSPISSILAEKKFLKRNFFLQVIESRYYPYMIEK